MKQIYLTCILALSVLVAEAQSFYSVRRDRTLIFSAGTGTSTYFGELQNPGDYFDARPNLNVGLQYFVSPRISVRAEATWFQLAGDDKKASSDGGRVTRNLSFVSNNYEIAVTGTVNLFPLGNRYYQRPAFNVYGFGGVGFLYFNPKTDFNGQRVALRPLQTEGVSYSAFQPIIPFGLGIKMKVGPFFNVALEGGSRITFTDYLDDVSTVHPDKSTWTDATRIALSDRRPELGLEPFPTGAVRGNPKTNDGYFLLNLKIEYYLPSTFLGIGSRSKSIYRNKRRGGGGTYKRRR